MKCVLRALEQEKQEQKAELDARSLSHRGPRAVVTAVQERSSPAAPGSRVSAWGLHGVTVPSDPAGPRGRRCGCSARAVLLLYPWADSEPPAQGSGSQGSHRPPAPECPGLVYWGGGPVGSAALGLGPRDCLVGFLLPETPDPPGLRPTAGDFSLMGGWVWTGAPHPVTQTPGIETLQSHGGVGMDRGTRPQ